jgi:hypothetical protein
MRVQFKNGRNTLIYKKIGHWCLIAFGLLFVNSFIRANMYILRRSCRRELLKIILDCFYRFKIRNKTIFSLNNISIHSLNQFSILFFMPFLRVGLDLIIVLKNSLLLLLVRFLREWKSVIKNITIKNGHWIWVQVIY